MPELQYLDTRLSCSWDASLLTPIAELNTEILESMFGAAACVGGEGNAASLQWRWRALDEAARLRLAHCPYLLLDAGFAAAETWVGLRRAGVHEVPPAPAAQGSQAPLGAALIRRVLHFAWHLARCNSPCARIALGMSLDCVTAVARCRLVELEALAEHRPAWIRPRWADLPGLWQALLESAALESPYTLQRLQLWGLQALAAEALARRPPVKYPVETCPDWP
jgi:hypothetical protein